MHDGLSPLIPTLAVSHRAGTWSRREKAQFDESQRAQALALPEDLPWGDVEQEIYGLLCASIVKLLLTCGMLLMAFAVAAPALGATADTSPCRFEGGRCVHFVTPDRDIECDISFDATAAGGGFGSVRCGVHRNRYRGSGSCLFRSRENPSRRWYIVGPAGNTNVGAYAQRRCFSGVPVTVLRDGQRVGVGPFRCRYRAPVVTCVNSRLGHGFSISNKTQRTF